jgi:hypothetical protein
VLEESEFLLPRIQAMSGLGKSMQFSWGGEVEDRFMMSAESLHELG